MTCCLVRDLLPLYIEDLAEKAGAGKKEAKLCAGFFNSLPQELLEGIYTAFHPAE